MNFRSQQYITKSNGFSLPLSRVWGHTHIVVLRFAYATPFLISGHGRVLVVVGRTAIDSANNGPAKMWRPKPLALPVTSQALA